MFESSPRVWLSVELDGEREAMTLDRFLEENEGAPFLCARVKHLQLGDKVVPEHGPTVERVAPPTKKKKGIARFVVPWKFDRSTTAVVTINRNTGIVAVRAKGRRRVAYAQLSDLAELIADRAAKAAVREKKKARRAARRKS